MPPVSPVLPPPRLCPPASEALFETCWQSRISLRLQQRPEQNDDGRWIGVRLHRNDVRAGADSRRCVYYNGLASRRGPHHQSALTAHLARFDPVPIHFVWRAETREPNALGQWMPPRLKKAQNLR